MNLEWLHRLGRRLPAPAREMLRPLTNFVYNHNSYPLDGPLAGHRMRGRYYYPGDYEPEVCRAIMLIVKPGWVCVDVGSHVGYFAMLMAKLSGDHGRVIAFDAHPENAKLLRANLKINGYGTRAKVENMAVTDGATDRVKLFPGRAHDSSGWNIVGHDDQGNPVQAELDVRATSLDAYFPAGSRIDFVKMDIEGAEAAAFRGMRRILRESQPLLLVEFHAEFNRDGWAGRFELFDANYSLYDIGKNRRLDRERDVERARHCLAMPENRDAGTLNL